MLIRQPIVAGRFYDGDGAALAAQVRAWLGARQNSPTAGQPGRQPAGEAAQARLWGVMLPHAGHIYCAHVLAATLAGLHLPPRLVILCPNHTGRGHPLGVWPDGAWRTPLGSVSVDDRLAAALVQSGAGFAPDRSSHLGEHSIEVLLPFLQLAAVEGLQITPICVGTQDAAALSAAGMGLAQVLAHCPAGETLVIVSSDMNHFDDEARTLAKDKLALARALAADPHGLLQTVQQENISMCGAGPLALALFAALQTGRPSLQLCAHDTSASVSGDRSHTVGYAGLRLYLADDEGRP